MDAHRATHRRVAIGVVLTAALLAAAAVIFFLDDIRRAQAPKYEIAVLFAEATDLREGGAVRVAGHTVGTVRKVKLVDRPTDVPERVVATIELPVEVRPHVRRRSRIRLIRQGIAGDAIVAIEPGPRDAPPLDPGDTLVADRPVRDDRLARAARDVLQAWDSLAASATALRGAAESAEPGLGRAIDRLGETGDEFERLRERYRTGPLGAMIRDPSWREAVERLRRASTAIRRAFDGVDAAVGDAPGGAVTARAGEVGRAIVRMVGRADSLRARLERLEERMRMQGGPAARLATDTALQAALRRARAQLDSLVVEARANPLRFVF